MKIIRLKTWGFNVLADLHDVNITSEESVHRLIDTLARIEDVNKLTTFTALKRHSGLNDVAGIVTNINGELEEQGCLIVL